jgi:hypothetical protein
MTVSNVFEQERCRDQEKVWHTLRDLAPTSSLLTGELRKAEGIALVSCSAFEVCFAISFANTKSAKREGSLRELLMDFGKGKV